jgi:hypothetical protein
LLKYYIPESGDIDHVTSATYDSIVEVIMPTDLKDALVSYFGTALHEASKPPREVLLARSFLQEYENRDTS